jgi:hypothetical protein
MSDINTDKKLEFGTGDVDFSSMTNVLDLILSLFKRPQKPLTPLPPPLLLTGAQLRPGITASEIASRIISRQSESGALVGNVFNDGDNIAQAMELIRVEEITNALLNEAKIEIYVPPGIAVQAYGANAGGPVVCVGTTISGIGCSGVLR